MSFWEKAKSKKKDRHESLVLDFRLATKQLIYVDKKKRHYYLSTNGVIYSCTIDLHGTQNRYLDIKEEGGKGKVKFFGKVAIIEDHEFILDQTMMQSFHRKYAVNKIDWDEYEVVHLDRDSNNYKYENLALIKKGTKEEFFKNYQKQKLEEELNEKEMRYYIRKSLWFFKKKGRAMTKEDYERIKASDFSTSAKKVKRRRNSKKKSN